MKLFIACALFVLAAAQPDDYNLYVKIEQQEMPEGYSGPPTYKFTTTIPEMAKYAAKMGLPVGQEGMPVVNTFSTSFDVTLPETQAAAAPVAPATYNFGVQPAVPYKPMYNAPFNVYSPYTAYPYAYNHHNLFKREADPEDTYNLFVKVNGEMPQGYNGPTMFKYSGNLAQVQGMMNQVIPGLSAYTHNLQTYKFGQPAPAQVARAYNPYFYPYNYGFHRLNKREAQPDDTYNLFVQIDGDMPPSMNVNQVQTYLRQFMPALAAGIPGFGNQAANTYGYPYAAPLAYANQWYGK